MKRTSRLPAKLSDSLDHRLKAYAYAAGAAGVSLLALAHPAQAKIVYTRGGVTFGGVASDNGRGIGGSYDLDLNHDGIPDFVFSWNAFSNDRPAYSAFADLYVHPIAFSNGIAGKPDHNYAFCMGSGASIGPQQPFAGSVMARIIVMNGLIYGNWGYPGSGPIGGPGNVKGVLGLKFGIHGQTHYGWARLNVFTNGASMTVALLGYAYETIPNKPIILTKAQGTCQRSKEYGGHANSASSGTVEPASLGRLAQGASGIAAWRRNQQTETTTK